VPLRKIHLKENIPPESDDREREVIHIMKRGSVRLKEVFKKSGRGGFNSERVHVVKYGLKRKNFIFQCRLPLAEAKNMKA